MPSQRQLRSLLVGVLVGVFFVLFVTSRLRPDHASDAQALQDFYRKTIHGLENKKLPAQEGIGVGLQDQDLDGDIDVDDEQLVRDMASRLREAEDKAKELANMKAPLKPDPPSEVIGVGNSAAHQDRIDEQKVDGGKNGVAEEAGDEPDPDELLAVEAELRSLMKKYPGKQENHLLVSPTVGVSTLTSHLFLKFILPFFVETDIISLTSSHLLQDVLLILEASQGCIAGQVCHRTASLRRRTRSAPSWPAAAGLPGREDRPDDCAQYLG